jgi:hypothetical protein
VHVVDQLEGEVGVLLDQQDGEAFFLQLANRFPDALDDDRRDLSGCLARQLRRRSAMPQFDSAICARAFCRLPAFSAE